jgi:hypothetical protein
VAVSAEAKGKGEGPIEPIDWPAPVLRVTLHWDGEGWSAADAIEVPSMTLPASDPTDPKMTTGFWVGALDAEGRLRYRTRLTDPLRGMEIFEESGGVTRLPHKAHDVDIEILVPDRHPVAELEIVSNATDRPDGIKPYTARLAIDRERIRQPGSNEPAAKGQGDHDGHHGERHDPHRD